MKKLSTQKIWFFATGQFGWAMLLFTAISTIGTASGTGYRMAAFLAAALCFAGGFIFLFYNERKIMKNIQE